MTKKLPAVAMFVFATMVEAKSPKLNLHLVHNNPLEMRKEMQIERLAEKYDLTKYTLTTEIAIEQGGMAHSKPVLTLNGRFMDDDDLALSQYVHEQGHWVLGKHQQQVRALFDDLKRAFPGLPTTYPQGGFGEQDTYLHLPDLMLEWQAMEDLVGEKRALAVMKFKEGDHYTELYKTVIENREEMEQILKRYGIGW
ncbi:hypothetical protein [Edaphobacter aggregans]|uniref:hypothetical protein n=1 Tax=Edaphobacter aggregans TaxID=570835 RepID=UPI00054E2A8A|nr:hypothetical protein [Edaphobacter aggregans]